MKSSKYLKTSEMAQVVHINKRTLHYYDDIGLFSPDYKDEKGYRYYSYTQIMDLSIILSLRELDMPLNEIREILSGNFDDYTLSLEHKLGDVDKKISELNSIREIISRKLAYIEQAERTHMKIKALQIEDSHLILSDPITDQSVLNLLNKAHQLVEEKSTFTLPNNEYGSMIQVEKKLKDPFNEQYDFMYIDAPSASPHYHIKPAGDYLSIVYRGTEETLPLAYSKLIDYAENKELSLEGYFYEKVLLDSIQKNQDNLVSEIQVKIKRAQI